MLSNEAMAIDVAVRDDGSIYLNDIYTQVAGRQAAYLASNGHYWQGLATHTLVPETAKALKTDRPLHDQEETWDDMNFTLPASKRFSVKVDVYEAPAGHGFVVTISTRSGQDICKKAKNFGPDTRREHDWICAVPKIP